MKWGSLLGLQAALGLVKRGWCPCRLRQPREVGFVEGGVLPRVAEALGPTWALEPLCPAFSGPQVRLAGAQCPPDPPGTSGSLWWAENSAREVQMAVGVFEPQAEWREGLGGRRQKRNAF